MQVTTVALKRLGRVDVLDLQMISDYLGRDFLPFPLMPTLPSRFEWMDDYTAHQRAIPDRFNHGDLNLFKKWFATYADADLRAECQVMYYPADTPAVRIVGHRSGQSGFLATQRADDTVDIFTLSPYDLGAAIAGTVELTDPGGRPQIMVPEYVPQSLRDSKGNVSVDNRRGSARPEAVPSADVAAYATVQSRRQPARTWGVDHDKDAVVWIRIRDDGDYIYAPGYRYATPMTRPDLRDRIDRLIADDVAILRESRGTS